MEPVIFLNKSARSFIQNSLSNLSDIRDLILFSYLFLIVMTVMFHDIHKNDNAQTEKHRILGTVRDEVLFADDTICISTDTKAMNLFLKDIELEGAKYGFAFASGLSAEDALFRQLTPGSQILLGKSLLSPSSGLGDKPSRGQTSHPNGGFPY